MTEHDYESTGEKFDDKFQEVDERIADLESSGGEFSGDGLLNIEGLAEALKPHLDVSGEVPTDVEESLASLRKAVDGNAATIADVQSSIDALAKDVAALQEGTGRSDEEIRQLIREYVDEHVTGGGGTDSERGAAIDRQINTLELLSQPTHRTVIDTGTPQEEMHPYGDWGQIVTVHDDVCWLSAVIDAETQGVTRFVIEKIDYEAEDTYDLGGVHATFEVDHAAGINEIHPRIVLPEGQYFISRDANQVVPMRRVMTDVDWDAFNQKNAAPVSFECSWRARADYQPGESGYQKYRDNNWHRRLYYFANMKFGHMASPEQRGG